MEGRNDKVDIISLARVPFPFAVSLPGEKGIDWGNKNEEGKESNKIDFNEISEILNLYPISNYSLSFSDNNKIKYNDGIIEHDESVLLETCLFGEVISDVWF